MDYCPKCGNDRFSMKNGWLTCLMCHWSEREDLDSIDFLLDEGEYEYDREYDEQRA